MDIAEQAPHLVRDWLDDRVSAAAAAAVAASAGAVGVALDPGWFVRESIVYSLHKLRLSLRPPRRGWRPCAPPDARDKHRPCGLVQCSAARFTCRRKNELRRLPCGEAEDGGERGSGRRRRWPLSWPPQACRPSAGTRRSRRRTGPRRFSAIRAWPPPPATRLRRGLRRGLRRASSTGTGEGFSPLFSYRRSAPAGAQRPRQGSPLVYIPNMIPPPSWD